MRAMTEHCRATEGVGWLANVIIALACTGLRIAELASLRWTDLNLETSRLTLTDETGRPVVEGRKRRELKSGRSRTFPIHPHLLSVLQGMPRVDACVFHGPRGGRLKPDTVRRILVREVLDGRHSRFPYARGSVISMPFWARSKFIVIHEVAHVLCNRHYGEDSIAPHGPEFAGLQVAMVSHFLGEQDGLDLRLAFTRFGVAHTLLGDEWSLTG
ncbi:MAG: tyrosine-type recombinase/integrase [Planctomycetota bacterium]|nr:tyrosine-type recombinase/integrase [Planctomycetota bacterium]